MSHSMTRPFLSTVRHRTLFTVLVSVGLSPLAWAQRGSYTVEELGTLGGATSVATDISEGGVVCGYSETADSRTRPFRWSRSRGMVHIDTPSGSLVRAFKISAGGDIAGMGNGRVILWTASGRTIDLGAIPVLPFPLDPSTASIRAINSRREVLVRLSRSGNAASFLFSARAEPVQLPGLDGTHSHATDLNNRGVVCGQSRLASGEFRAFVWSAPSGILSLPSLGGAYSRADRINASGMVMGISQETASVNSFSAFLWTPRAGIFVLPGTSPAGGSSGENGSHLTDSGHVFGAVRGSGYTTAYHWSNRTGTVILPTLEPSPGYLDVRLEDVNARGQACGTENRGTSLFTRHTFPIVYDARGMVTELPNLGVRVLGGIRLFGAAHAMNNAGVIAGLAFPTGTRGRAAVWSPGR